MSKRYEGFICDGCSNLCEDYYPGIDMCPYDENLRCDCGYNIKCPMRQQKNTRAPKINRVRHKQLEKARRINKWNDNICGHCSHFSIGFTYCTVDLSAVNDTDVCKNGKFSDREY